MTSLGKQILSPLLAFIPPSDSPSSSSPTQPLPRPHIHLYALLAALLLYSPTLKSPAGTSKPNPLASHPLVHLLTTAEEYEPLRRFVHQMHGEIWGASEGQMRAEQKEQEEASRVYGDLAGWNSLYSASSTSTGSGSAGEDSPRDASLSSTSGSSNSWRSYLPTFLRPASATATSTGTSRRTKESDEPLSPQQQAALRRLRIGRAIWITSALLGTVGWLLVSGIVQVSFSDEDDEEEEGEEEVDLIVEDREGGEEVEVVLLDGEEDEEGEEDDEDDEDDEDVEWTFVRGSEQVDLDEPVEIVLEDDDGEDEI